MGCGIEYAGAGLRRAAGGHPQHPPPPRLAFLTVYFFSEPLCLPCPAPLWSTEKGQSPIPMSDTAILSTA